MQVLWTDSSDKLTHQGHNVMSRSGGAESSSTNLQWSRKKLIGVNYSRSGSHKVLSEP